MCQYHRNYMSCNDVGLGRFNFFTKEICTEFFSIYVHIWGWGIHVFQGAGVCTCRGHGSSRNALPHQQWILFFFSLSYFLVYGCFTSIPICEKHACLLITEARMDVELLPQYPHGHSKLSVRTMNVHIGVGKQWVLLMGPYIHHQLLWVHMLGFLPNPQGLPIKLTSVPKGMWISLSSYSDTGMWISLS